LAILHLVAIHHWHFSSYNGSDKVWEINSLIQMMSKKYGFTEYVRPAPSKYLLKMFNGNLTIEEFRALHKNNETSIGLSQYNPQDTLE
jgi:hypothetical protein